mgnify:CR=1 FL=1
MKKPGSSLFLSGGIFAGLSASLCCIAPLLSLSLGFGSFAASAWFAEWRSVLLALTFILLGLAWWLTYRGSKSTCEDASCAQPPSKAARISLWLGTLVALGSAIYPSLPVEDHPIDTASIVASDASLEVMIPSMDCASCATGIQASLGRAPGVKQAAVDYSSKTAVLIYDPTVVSQVELLLLIDATGYPADRSTLK